MEITIKQYGLKYSLDDKSADTNIEDVTIMFFKLLRAIQYSEERISEMEDKLDLPELTTTENNNDI